MFYGLVELDRINFSSLDRYEISKGLSCVQINVPSSTVKFEKNQTLHDTRLGAFKNVKCGTCGEGPVRCTGHMGHIELYFPVLNPNLTSTLKKILDTFCFECFNVLDKSCTCSDSKANTKKTSTKPPTKKKRKIIDEQINTVNTSKSKFVKIKKRNNLLGRCNIPIYFELHDGNKEFPTPVSTKELYELLVKIPRKVYLKHFPEFKNFTDITDSCFIHNLPVLPTCTRVPNYVQGEWYPDHITTLYSEIIKKSLWLQSEDREQTISSLMTEYHADLQNAVNTLFDTNLCKTKTSQKVLQNGGLRQRIDGKTGRMRSNLMGKRVNFSARTVLSGDTNLGINEIGIPRSIANDLTIPIHVNKYNFHKISEYNTKYVFKKGDKDQRFDLSITHYPIEIGDVVERSLINGDIVIMNRQPTLHRGSMVACYVKIFDCSTFRMNYSTMITLNADTDGDELNLHVPQDIMSRAELEELMLASTNIVCSQNNKPLIGLSQDSLLGTYKLSKTLISERDIYDILYKSNCYKNFDHIKPDILKPSKQFSGVRVLEFVLDYYNIEIDYYEQPKAGEFLIIENRVIRGIFNKHSVGTSDNSIFHQIYLRYDHKTAANVMFTLQKIATAFLDIHGFSVGISDCVVDYEPINVDELDNFLKHKVNDKGKLPCESKLTDALGRMTQLEPPKDQLVDNRMIDMIVSGAKGSMVKFNQITRCVGQQFEASGRIIPELNKGTRTLPHYTKHDTSVESRGFVKNSFIKGLTPQEFFLHSVPSRITLLDTALKTSVTGAQYRRLVKCLENAKVHEDHLGNRRVVNTSTNIIIQFNYGEDDMQGEYMKKEITS